MGWYYLNVSRLQNAADAAAVAGAQTLIDNENFSDYKSVTLTSKYPGKVSEQYRTAETAKIEAISESRDAAKEYVAKNLSSNEGNIINSWTHEKVETETPTLYEKDDNLYFVVQLREEIRHFFLPGWFDDMDAPVTAVAMITKSAISDPSEPSTPETTSTPTTPTKPDAPASSQTPQAPVEEEDPKEITPELTDNLETAKNVNVIVGNWEVQKYYRQINNSKIKNTYLEIYGSEICVNGWNMFQDENVHYTNGNLYRTEHIKIFDDVELNNYELTGKERYTDSNVKKLSGATGDSAYALKGSSVKKTAQDASTNTLNEESYTYNKGGYPYVWQDLDSIDVDFQPEVSFKETSPYLSKDWDLPMGYDAPNIMHSIGSGRANVGVGSLGNYAWHDHLRIHSTITFGEPYKERTSSPPREDMNLPDILWARIESEPMFRYPDSIDHYVKTILDIKGLNSVRQIILNFTVSNYDTATQKYRPVVIFYDGPEMYYPYSTSEDSRNKIRTSRPIIVNLNVPYRLILYAPNSPVVVMGTATDGFQGFIVAKKYLRLKTAEDFKKFEGFFC